MWQAGDKIRVTGSQTLLATNGATMYITGVQLEKGTVATPFEFRPYPTEVALCYRYFISLGGPMYYNYFGTGVSYSATGAYILCPLPVPMRSPGTSTVSVPAGSAINILGLISGVYGSAAVAAIAKDQHNLNNIELNITSANMTTGSPYMMYTNNNLTSFIYINNEL